MQCMQRYLEISPFNLQKLNYNRKTKEYTGQRWVHVIFFSTCKHAEQQMCFSLSWKAEYAASLTNFLLHGTRYSATLNACLVLIPFLANNLDLFLVTVEISTLRHLRREQRHKRNMTHLL